MLHCTASGVSCVYLTSSSWRRHKIKAIEGKKEKKNQ
jgi:hypothetical protein